MRWVGEGAQSTYTYRVPQCMSARRNWDSPTPSPASECAPPDPKVGGAHSPAHEGMGESQFRRQSTLWAGGKYTRYYDYVSPTKVSPKDFSGTMSLLDDLSLGRSVPERCVPNLHSIYGRPTIIATASCRNLGFPGPSFAHLTRKKWLSCILPATMARYRHRLFLLLII
jgi:hypothetical protein